MEPAFHLTDPQNPLSDAARLHRVGSCMPDDRFAALGLELARFSVREQPPRRAAP